MGKPTDIYLSAAPFGCYPLGSRAERIATAILHSELARYILLYLNNIIIIYTRIIIYTGVDVLCMKRRQMLIGSGTMLATGLVGYSSAASAHNSKDDHTKSEQKEHRKRESNKDNEDIPGFDREAFEFDSDVLHLKELTFQKGTLELSVIVTTTDQDVLTEELQALVPAFRQAIREADADGFDTEYDEFFEAVEEFKFTLYDERNTKRAAIFLDVQWLRECLFGDLTNEEFVNRLLRLLGGGGGNDGPPEPQEVIPIRVN